MVDGEHYPPVIEAALSDLRVSGHSVAGCVLVGGVEKIGPGGLTQLGGVPVESGPDPLRLLETSLMKLQPDAVLDLSDEPVLDYRRRHALAGVALNNGVPYKGADFIFSPPPRPHLAKKPSVAVIGTGKRTGKTAVAGFAARALVDEGRHPVVVAMGRGGPPEPEILRGDEISLTPTQLLALADSGRHAASDYIEDALLARVPTVGCRRCGGGLAGAVENSNVAQGIVMANDLPGDLLLLEGSGSAIPPAHADATILVVPATIPKEYLVGYMGLYRLLLCDTVVVTMCESPFGSPSRISSIVSSIQRSFRPKTKGEGARGEIQVVRTVFRPAPTASVDGADVFVATTAPEKAAESITSHLERVHGCRVVGITHSLSDRARLEAEIGALGGGADILLCEVKAAGIDVATRKALDGGLEVVYMDNAPCGIDGDDVTSAVVRAADLADARYGEPAA